MTIIFLDIGHHMKDLERRLLGRLMSRDIYIKVATYISSCVLESQMGLSPAVESKSIHLSKLRALENGVTQVTQ